jgi:hypothetical protein
MAANTREDPDDIGLRVIGLSRRAVPLLDLDRGLSFTQTSQPFSFRGSHEIVSKRVAMLHSVVRLFDYAQ